MIVVSNTSPIINLAAIGQLELLQKLYGKLIIPEAVFHEISAIDPDQLRTTKIQSLSWIKTQSVTNQALVASLLLELDRGEAEAIILAVEKKADLLLLDERRGRTVAYQLGIKFIGLLGILIEAKHQQIISAVKPLLDELIAKAGFWVSTHLYNCVLKAAGE